MTDHIEFGLVASQFTGRFDHLVGDVQLAEQVGLDSAWLVDHLLGTSAASSDMLEGWTSLAFVAGITDRIRLGHLVNCVAFRNVGLLAKMVATVDRASGGRLELGLGAGWYEREYAAFGYRFGTRAERRRYFEEYLDALIGLLSGAQVDVEGEFIRLDKAVCRPRPIQQPYPPIVVGAGGALMRRLTGQRADTWNCPASLLPGFDEALATVRDAAAGRRVRTTIQVPVAVGRTAAEAAAAMTLAEDHLAWMGDVAAVGITGTVDAAVEQVAAYRARGVDGFIAVVPGSRQRPDFIAAYGAVAAECRHRFKLRPYLGR